jgi:hypothetical protein
MARAATGSRNDNELADDHEDEERAGQRPPEHRLSTPEGTIEQRLTGTVLLVHRPH